MGEGARYLPGMTYRDDWPAHLRPSFPEADVRDLANPGHGRSLPARRSVDGTMNYCLSCPRVVRPRQRFCEIHRSIRGAWLGTGTAPTGELKLEHARLPLELVEALNELRAAVERADAGTWSCECSRDLRGFMEAARKVVTCGSRGVMPGRRRVADRVTSAPAGLTDPCVCH